MTWRIALGFVCIFCCGYFIGWARTNVMAYAAGRRDAVNHRYAIEALELERIGKLQ